MAYESPKFACPGCGKVRRARNEQDRCAKCREPEPGAYLYHSHGRSRGYGPIDVDEFADAEIRKAVAELRERFAA